MEMSKVFTTPGGLVAHRNARLNVRGRLLLVERVLSMARPVTHVAGRVWYKRGEDLVEPAFTELR